MSDQPPAGAALVFQVGTPTHLHEGDKAHV